MNKDLDISSFVDGFYTTESDFQERPSTSGNVIVTGYDTVFPPFIIWIYQLAVVLSGIILNGIAIRTILKSKCNGTLYFLLQLACCDITSLAISGIELFFMNNRGCNLSSEICQLFMGLDAFTNTATIYFIIGSNLHTISTYNLAIKTLMKMENLSNNDHHSGNEGGCSGELDDEAYEVAENLTKRTLTIDYNKKQTSISVILPTLFVWFLAASISVPLFVFSDILPGNTPNTKVCGLVNFDEKTNILMQVFMIIIRIIVPITCLSGTTIMICIKLSQSRATIRPCGLSENVRSILRLSLVLSISFVVFSMQKIYGSLLIELFSKPLLYFKYPLIDRFVGIISVMIHYLLPAFRPIIYCLITKNLRDDFLICFGASRRNKKKTPN